MIQITLTDHQSRALNSVPNFVHITTYLAYVALVFEYTTDQDCSIFRLMCTKALED